MKKYISTSLCEYMTELIYASQSSTTYIEVPQYHSQVLWSSIILNYYSQQNTIYTFLCHQKTKDFSSKMLFHWKHIFWISNFDTQSVRILVLQKAKKSESQIAVYLLSLCLLIRKIMIHFSYIWHCQDHVANNTKFVELAWTVRQHKHFVHPHILQWLCALNGSNEIILCGWAIVKREYGLLSSPPIHHYAYYNNVLQ